MPYSVYSFPLKSNQATLVASAVYMQEPAVSLMATVSTWSLGGDIALALCARTHVLSPYPRIPLMNPTDILSHKLPGAVFTLDRTAQALGLLVLATLGMGGSEYLMTTLHHWSAGGSGQMQVFMSD